MLIKQRDRHVSNSPMSARLECLRLPSLHLDSREEAGIIMYSINYCQMSWIHLFICMCTSAPIVYYWIYSFLCQWISISCREIRIRMDYLAKKRIEKAIILLLLAALVPCAVTLAPQPIIVTITPQNFQVPSYCRVSAA